MHQPITLGVDLDGVLADYIQAWSSHALRHLGKIIRPGEAGPTNWNWDQDAGLTSEDRTKLWDLVNTDETWWEKLDPLPGAEKAIRALNAWSYWGKVAPYFITARPGRYAMRSSQRWLQCYGARYPSVLVATDALGKARISLGLGLDMFIDDAPDNLSYVADFSPKTTLYRAAAPYNEGAPGIPVNITGFIEAIEKRLKHDGIR